MSIANYANLGTAFDEYMGRDDLAGSLGDFVTLAEARFSKIIRHRSMETSTTATLSASGGITLPSDYLEWISVNFAGSRTLDLRYVEPDSEEWRFRYRPNGDPSMFTIIADSLLVRPVGSGDATLYYYQAIPSLVSSSTNWLMTARPDIYLYGTLAEAYIFQKDETRATAFLNSMYAEADALSNSPDSNKVGRLPLRAARTQAVAETRNPATGSP